MSTKVARAKARKDATEAVHTLADAGRIVAGSTAASVGSSVSELSDTLSGRVDDARHALAEAIDPTPAKVRRAPWILAVLVLSGLAAYAWAMLLRRESPPDPGTPVSTTPPSTDQLHGKTTQAQAPTES